MQPRYVFTELRQGLRRNLSMHLAVVLTLLVSLTLAGLGILLRQEANLTEQQWGNELQLTFYLCNGVDDRSAKCSGPVDDSQKQVIEKTLKASPYVDSFRLESQAEAYQRLKAFGDKTVTGPDPVIKQSDMWQSYWVTMTDPHKSNEIVEGIQGLDGVDHFSDLHQVMGPVLSAIDGLQNAALVGALVLIIAALLLVSNTIRLAAFARRREIGIMRLVGASTLYIALPFLLEAFVTAVAGIVLAGGALALVIWLGVVRRLSNAHWTAWVGWHEYWVTFGIVAALGVVLTLLPTLLLTRKYLKV
jgi:cell division transport system permease protein